jgi:putrescine transport system substrate-binding protein
MAGEGQEMAPVMDKFMDKIAGNERKGPLLGADEINRNECENADKRKPRKNFAKGDGDRPSRRNKNVATHTQPQGTATGRARHGYGPVRVAASVLAVNALSERAFYGKAAGDRQAHGDTPLGVFGEKRRAACEDCPTPRTTSKFLPTPAELHMGETPNIWRQTALPLSRKPSAVRTKRANKNLLKPGIIALFLFGHFSCAELAPAWAEERLVSVYGFADYIDPKIIDDFTKETGIAVTYDAYDSAESLETKALSGKSGFDVLIVPGRELQRLVAGGRLQRLDKNKLPNSTKLWPEIMARLSAYDPGNQYAVNYLWFTIGLAYNAGRLKEVLGDAAAAAWQGSAGDSLASWDVLFRPEILRKFSGCGVSVLDSGEDLFAIALIYLKTDPASMRPSFLKWAGDVLSVMRRNIKKFDSNGYADALANGDICLALGQSVESLRARDRTREAGSDVEIGFAIPKEGSLMLLDNLAIPAGAQHVDEAYAFIDFLLRPEIAARTTNFTHLASGVFAAKPAVDARITETAALYPSDSVLHRLYAAPNRDPAAQKTIAREWARIKAGKGSP